MKVEVYLKDAKAWPLQLSDGEEGNPKHEALAPAIVTVVEAFGGWLHGFDPHGKAVVVPEHSINYVRILEP